MRQWSKYGHKPRVEKAELAQKMEEHSVSVKAKEKEVLDLQIALTDAKERILREAKRNRQRELELFAETEEIRRQCMEYKELADELTDAIQEGPAPTEIASEPTTTTTTEPHSEETANNPLHDANPPSSTDQPSSPKPQPEQPDHTPDPKNILDILEEE